MRGINWSFERSSSGILVNLAIKSMNYLTKRAFQAIAAALIIGSGTGPVPVQAACSDEPAPKVNWIGCDKRGVDLSGLDLSGAILTRADLREANL